MNYTTHPIFEAAYDCPKFEIVSGEKRFHALGDKSNCPKCKSFLNSF